MSHYVHFSYPEFSKLAEMGMVSWEAVKALAGDKKAGKKGMSDHDASLQLDENGFPASKSMEGRIEGGEASLQACLVASKVHSYVLTSRDIAIHKRSDGTIGTLLFEIKHTSRFRQEYDQRAAKLTYCRSEAGKEWQVPLELWVETETTLDRVADRA